MSTMADRKAETGANSATYLTRPPNRIRSNTLPDRQIGPNYCSLWLVLSVASVCLWPLWCLWLVYRGVCG